MKVELPITIINPLAAYNQEQKVSSSDSVQTALESFLIRLFIPTQKIFSPIPRISIMEFINNEQQKLLIAELEKAQIKHTSENIIRITKDPNEKIIFLETGKGGERGSGLLHILENHREDFLKRSIAEEQIPDLIIRAISEGTIIGIQGKSRIIYQVEINEILQYVSLEISYNGYIVSANPTPTRLINKLIQE